MFGGICRSKYFSDLFTTFKCDTNYIFDITQLALNLGLVNGLKYLYVNIPRICKKSKILTNFAELN